MPLASMLLFLSRVVAATVSSPQAVCSAVMSVEGSGLSNQDIEGAESPQACTKNLIQHWWPAELPHWTVGQWCSETWRHNVDQKPSTIPNIQGKIILVTGGDTGLGFATMKALALSGADVAYTSRNCNCAQNKYTTRWPKQCEELDALRASVLSRFQVSLTCYELDLLSATSFGQFLQKARADFAERGLDVLVNNAGMVDTATQDAIFTANYIGTFAVTKGLWDVMRATAGQGRHVRIITTSSVERLVLNSTILQGFVNHFNTQGQGDFLKSLEAGTRFTEAAVGDDSTKLIPVAYSLSKLADMMFALRLQALIERSPDVTNIQAVSTHPGASHTLMMRNTAVGQMTRDQGVLPNLVAIAWDGFNKSQPNFVGPVLRRAEFEYYKLLDVGRDDSLGQFSLGRRVAKGTLDEDSVPLEALSCMEMVGFPMQYPSLRKVEGDETLQTKLWGIAEQGMAQRYASAWQPEGPAWSGLHMQPVAPIMI